MLPKKNERDLKEVPDEVKNSLEFFFVETVEEALHHVLGLEPHHWGGPRGIGSSMTSTAGAHGALAKSAE
jgi:predicted ATP-dependent protease